MIASEMEEMIRRNRYNWTRLWQRRASLTESMSIMFASSLFAVPFELNEQIATMRAAACEQLLICHLGSDRTVSATQFESSGWQDKVSLPLRKIIADAIRHDSEAVILIHNHPSGIAEPSRNDIQQTRLLERALFPLQIILEDHWIVTAADRFSFRAAGLL